MMLVAILVALIAIGSGQDQCLCPCQNVNTTCQAASITCVNGGAFGAHDCQTTRPCKGPSPVTRCTCPVGYTGVGCDIINPSNSDVCETSRLMYDSSMLNSAAAKYMECTAEITPILQLANLQDHRMNITLDLPNRQAVVALWTRTSKTKGMCGPIIQFFKCTVSDCSLLANTPGTLSTLSCPKKACEICTDPSCPVALQSIIQSFEEKKTPLTILIDPTQRHNINMTVGLDAFVNVKIPVNCMTGSCVSKIDYVPDNAPAIDKSSEMLMMGFWSSLALSMYLVLAVLAVYVNMELNNPPPAIKAMMLDHSHDKPDKHFGKDDGGYERLSTGSPISNSSELSNHPDAILIDDIPDEPLPSSMNPHGTFGLLWKDVGYRMSSRRHGLLCRRRPPKLILSKSTGIVHPGEMVAILGASGAGKSTLLDILGGIDKKGVISGFVDIFGDLNVHRKNVVSYVVQEDYNLSTMTVWETLDFSARMRLSADTSDAEIMARVRAVIEELALVKVATTKVGTLERGGISGGERRRLAIGVELVADPRILLADEPTSGLDSFYADMVIQSLRRRAVRDRCAVLLTIHQPPSHLFPLFHRVVLMCRGGTMAFNGTPDQAIAFFEQETGQTMKPGANPFEFLVEALSNRSTAFNTAIVRHFEESTYCRDMANSVIENIQSKEYVKSLPLRSVQRVSRLNQCKLLTLRAFRHSARDPSLLLMYNCVTMVVAVLTGLIFYQLDNRIVGSQNRIGFLFFAILFLSLLNMSSMGHFVLDRILLWRERFAGFYTIGPYFASKLLVDLVPFRVLPPALFSCIAYWLVGLQPDMAHFMRFVGVLILTNMVSGSSVFLISAASSNLGQANLFGILYFIYAMVFGGLLLNAGSSTSALSALSCTSFISYAYSSIMANEFHNLPLILDPKGFNGIEVNVDGDTILQNFGFSWDQFDHNILILSCAFVTITTTTYIILKNCQTRRK